MRHIAARGAHTAAAGRGGARVCGCRFGATAGVWGRQAGAAFGHAKIASKSLLVRGLNALVAALSTPLAAPVVTTARLWGGAIRR
ncbi:MAG: hypothetical protein JO287_23855 [Pseudonocardiales bacterium]|nr:hypothetical protein [Pseudonocardiales bacterium]